MPLVTGSAMLGGGAAAGQLLGNAPLGYTAVLGAPILGANAFNAINRAGASAVARGGATGAERTVPGALQGLMAEDDLPPLEIEIVGGKREKKNKKK